jgi:hypothetical protein
MRAVLAFLGTAVGIIIVIGVWLIALLLSPFIWVAILISLLVK